MTKLLLNKKNELQSQKRKKGFTLIELIIVIAIIAILAAMAIPKFSAVRIDAKVSNDVAAAKNIQSAAQILVSEGSIADNTPNIDVSDATANSEGDKISQRVASNGKASKVAPEALSGAKFIVDVGAKGDVTVSVSNETGSGDTAKGGKYQLVPETDTNGKTAYTQAAQK